MTLVSDTPYPQLPVAPSERELRDLFLPTPADLQFASAHTSRMTARITFLLLWKTYQRLGYPVMLATIPAPIVTAMGQHFRYPLVSDDLARYDASGTRRRHLRIICDQRGLKPADAAMQAVLVQAMQASAASKDDVSDLINIAIEELIRQEFELPAFSTLERTAKRIRAEMATALQQQVMTGLTKEEQATIDRLFIVDPTTGESLWNQIKADPANPTLSHFADLLKHATWLTAIPITTAALAGVPAIKIQRFTTEALALDANRMKDVQPRKRYTLALSLL